MIKVVLFDLDDTLISEDDYIKSGYNHVAKVIENRYSLNAIEIYDDLYRLYIEDSKNVFNRVLDKYDIKYNKDDIMFLVNEYRNHIPTIEFYDDVVPTITELKKRGIKIGIISDGYLSTQKNKAEVLGLYNLFDKVIFTEEFGREYWKPHPKSFEIMKEYFDVNYDEMIYIGDNPEKDFFISSIYPIKTIRINRNKSVYLTSQYLNDIRETYAVSSLDEILLIAKGDFYENSNTCK